MMAEDGRFLKGTDKFLGRKCQLVGWGRGRGCWKHLDSRGHFPFGARRPRKSGLRQRSESRFDPGGSCGQERRARRAASSLGPLGEDSEGRRGRGRRRLPVPNAPARVSFCFWGLRGGEGGWAEGNPHLHLFVRRGQQKTLPPEWAGSAEPDWPRRTGARGLGSSPYGPGRSYRPGRTAEWPPG